MMLFLNWANESAKNAVELSEEAGILLDNGRKSRAYYLAHMATEEASKAILLKAMIIFNTPDSELKKIDKLLRNHEKKIAFLIQFSASYSNTLFQEIVTMKKELTSHINTLKNNAMYVSLIDGEVVTPSNKLGHIDIEHYIEFSNKLATYSMHMNISSGGVSDSVHIID